MESINVAAGFLPNRTLEFPMNENEKQLAIATACLRAAETNTKTFPEVLAMLAQAGFEGYEIDFRRGAAAYYTSCGDCVVLEMHKVGEPIGEAFDAKALQAAIREAQAQVPGYTYIGFCKKAVAAGCASYIVSLSGRRALYIGRTAETHVELFPK
jgi:uncharacterized protein YbcV (DUF1398 family)